MPVGVSQASEFKHCVLGGPSIMGGSNGFPDGDPSPSVTLDYKQILTLTPGIGRNTLAFMLAPHSNGCLSVIDGVVSQSVQFLSGPTPAAANGWTVNSAAGADLIGAIPDPKLGQGPAILPNYGSSSSVSNFAGFRPIVAVANVEYTGTPLYAGGSVSVTNYPLRLQRSGTAAYTFNTTESATATKVESRQQDAAINSVLPNTTVMPARESFTARVLSPPGPFASIEATIVEPASVAPAATSPFGFAVARSSGGSFPAPTWYPNTTAKVVRYSGLDSTASITVTVRYCVQLALSADNELSALARPSPPKDTQTISWYETLTSKLPTIENLVRISRAVMPMMGVRNGYMSLNDEL